MFDLEKKGYNKDQVNQFVAKTDRVMSALRAKNVDLMNEIANLEEEVEVLKNERLKAEEKTILAIQNENNSKKIYDLEMSRLDSLISSWEDALKKIREKYGIISSVEKKALAFKNELQEKTQRVIDLTFGRREEINDDKIHHKQLLSKMSGLLNSATSQNVSSSYEIEKNEEFRRLDESLKKSQQLKENKKDYSKILNKYLAGENESDKAGGEEIFGVPKYFPEPNASGFDLKEAVNPKASLDEIMEDFDFFKPEENMKKKIKIK